LEISIIIPVYNAESYLEIAVSSALAQPEVGEVLLIEDGSSDSSLRLCQELEQRYPKVKLYQHPGGVNLGPSASRNLGIHSAKCEYIAFLDADDYYLPNRFSIAISILHEQSEVDGVYEATGTFFEDEESKQLFKKTPQVELLTINKLINPDELFESFMFGDAGEGFSFDGFTGRRNLFEDENLLFDTALGIGEDTLLMYQLSAKTNLTGGEIRNPVTLRRIHTTNRITHYQKLERRAHAARVAVLSKLLSWAKKNLTIEQTTLVVLKYIYEVKITDRFQDYSLKDFARSRSIILITILSNVSLFVNYKFWKTLASKKLIGKYLEKNRNSKKTIIP
jgi:glycosyltransferase involved in cell wall biosynthesis